MLRFLLGLIFQGQVEPREDVGLCSYPLFHDNDFSGVDNS